MKQLLPCLCLLFLLSCKDKPKPIVDTKTKGAEKLVPMEEDDPINNYAAVDVSPMDMSYYPVDYPKLKMANAISTSPLVRVIYSRPHLQRRHFNDILKYNEPWRLGANESTEIEFFKSVKVQDQKVSPGRYIIYCIPEADKWTIILNSNIDTWGLKQDSTRDVHRFPIPITRNNPTLEYFTMVFEKTGTGADLLMGWDDVVGKLPLTF